MMGLKTVHPASLDGLESLRLLSLSQNKLEHLPERLLEPVPNLRKLLLGGKGPVEGNLLAELPAEVFGYTPDLTLLDVSENQLQRCNFRHLAKLKTLDLQSNRISQLPADVFEELTALKELDLRDNELSVLPEKLFQNLTALKTLRLSSNELSELPGICERIRCY